MNVKFYLSEWLQREIAIVGYDSTGMVFHSPLLWWKGEESKANAIEWIFVQVDPPWISPPAAHSPAPYIM